MLLRLPQRERVMDRLEAMSIVLLTVEKGSMTAAAKALNMPLPTVSRKLSELENHLGIKLLQRSTRQLTLTDAGRDYVAGVKRIMEEIDQVDERHPVNTPGREASWC